ncbi:MAG: nucleoside monophosphate kinase [Elusimicrobiales bacterium]|nr:nucleoside monophosphate kinase [Elusimicrobiales bacterium]
MNIVLLGSPGSGKGTQSRAISTKLNLVHFSPGDTFWAEMGKKTPLGQEVEDYVAQGRLVPDWLILQILKEKFVAEKRGLLLDGFPRTMEQVDELDNWLASRSAIVDAVVYLNLSEAEALKRLEGRRVCTGCGMVFNLATTKPLLENICDNCSGPILPRQDDSANVVKQRIMVYRDQTEPLISYYRSNTEFIEIKAAQPPQAITAQILARLKA